MASDNDHAALGRLQTAKRLTTCLAPGMGTHVNFLARDVDDYKKLVHQESEACEVDDDVFPGPEVVDRVAHRPDFKDLELAIIASLGNNKFLARSFSIKYDKIVFVVIDSTAPEPVVFQFEYDLLDLVDYTTRLIHINSSHRPVYEGVRFRCTVTADKRFVVLVGPLNENSPVRVWHPLVQVLKRDPWQIQRFTHEACSNYGALKLVEADSRPGRHHFITALHVKYKRDGHFRTEHAECLIQYDLDSMKVTQVSQPVPLGYCYHLSLSVIHNGEHLVARLVDIEDKKPMIVRVVDTTSLIPLVQVSIESHIYGHTILESQCYCHLVYCKWFGGTQSKVGLVDNYVRDTWMWMISLGKHNCSLRNLKDLARACILAQMTLQTIHHIDALPLPQQLISYLRGYEP